ncbi:MAG: hypothetical protein KF861_24685, partial [Planctomycetaceae bacterium]|nr:hypothetical protein [Planctomycetaceae bacterium]
MGNKVTDSIYQFLAEVLSESDAIWTTPRWPGNKRAFRNLVPLRQQYRDHGVRWKVGGDDAARKAGQRLLQDAEQAGWVTLSKSRGSDGITHVKLTDAGDWTARAIVDLNDKAESWDAMGAISVGIDDWVSEFELGVELNDSYP